MNNFEAHILVVDDDDGIRDLVKKYLNENNFLVTTAKNAEDAYKKTNIIKFDLIIHLAALPGVRISMNNPITCINSNIKGFQNILEFARKKNSNPSYFTYC